jgi:Tfp pilus assembly protein PilF
MVAALFALHPVNVESVAWAAERKNVLSMFFFLFALHAYGKYTRQPGTGRYALVALFFALGLMAKPQVITFPFLLLLWEYWPLHRFGEASDQPEAGVAAGRPFLALLREKIPLFVLAACSAIVTLQAQHAGHAVRTVAEYGLWARLGNAVVSYVRYIGHAFCPRHLAPLYPHPGNSLPVWEVAASAILLVGITRLVISLRRRGYLVVGWFWFLGTLVPMIGLLQVGEQGMADRYAYLPLIGLFIIVVWGIADLAAQYGRSGSWLAIPAVTVLLAFGWLSHHQISYWKDSETLWTYTLSVTRQNFMAHDNLGTALAKQGRSQEAIREFHAAEEIHTYPPSEILKLGLYEQNAGYPEGAILQFKKVLQASSESSMRAAAFANLGLSYLQLWDSNQARQSYQEGLRLDPGNSSALIGLGVLAQREGDFGRAADYYSDSVKIQPSDLGFLLLASALRSAGRLAEAGTAYEQAQRLSDDLPRAQASAHQLLSPNSSQ